MLNSITIAISIEIWEAIKPKLVKNPPSNKTFYNDIVDCLALGCKLFYMEIVHNVGCFKLLAHNSQNIKYIDRIIGTRI